MQCILLVYILIVLKNKVNMSHSLTVARILKYDFSVKEVYNYYNHSCLFR
jgi:hypothetical protein